MSLTGFAARFCRAGWSLAATCRVRRDGGADSDFVKALVAAVTPLPSTRALSHSWPVAEALEAAAADIAALAPKEREDFVVRVWRPAAGMSCPEAASATTERVPCHPQPAVGDGDTRGRGPVMFHGLGQLPASLHGHNRNYIEDPLRELQRCIFRIGRAEFGGAFFTPSLRLAQSFAVPMVAESASLVLDPSVSSSTATCRLVLMVQLSMPLTMFYLLHPDTDRKIGDLVDSAHGDWRQVYRRLETSDPLRRRVDGYISLAEDTVPVCCLRGEQIESNELDEECAESGSRETTQSLWRLLRVVAMIELP